MRLEVEKKQPIENVTDTKVTRAILALRSYGPSSFASLSDDKGNFLQVAGGGVTCMLERRDASSKRHYRAYNEERSKVFPDGTLLVFGGGKLPLQADEWFNAQVVVEVFLAFLNGRELPESIRWRDVTDTAT